MLLLRRDLVRAHLPAAARARTSASRRRARSCPYLRRLGVSHLYLSPCLQARAGSTHGYDVIDPRRISADLGGEAAFRALAGGRARRCCSTSSRTTWPPTTRTRFWADPALRERFFDIDPRTGRHRRFFSIDELAGVRVEDPEVFETTHALVLGLVAEGVVDGLRIDHPDGLADPGGYLRRLAERGVERDLGGEDPRARRGAARLAGGGHDRLRVHGRRHRPVHRPGRRGAADRALRARSPASGATSPSWPTRPSASEAPHHLPARGRAPAGAGGRAGHGRRGRRACRSTAPTSSPRARAPTTRTCAWSRRPTCPSGVREALVDPSDADEEAFAVRFQQTTGAIMAKGVEDTALYRYSRLARAQRGRLATPGAGAAAPEEVHAAHLARAPALPALPARHPDARHQALGRRARAHRRARRDPGRVARAGAGAGGR